MRRIGQRLRQIVYLRIAAAFELHRVIAVRQTLCRFGDACDGRGDVVRRIERNEKAEEYQHNGNHHGLAFQNGNSRLHRHQRRIQQQIAQHAAVILAVHGAAVDQHLILQIRVGDLAADRAGAAVLEVDEIEKCPVSLAVQQALAVVYTIIIDFSAVCVEQFNAHFVLQRNFLGILRKVIAAIVRDQLLCQLCGVPDFHGLIEPFQKDDLEQPHEQKDHAHEQHEKQPHFYADAKISLTEPVMRMMRHFPDQTYIPFLSRSQYLCDTVQGCRAAS